MHSSFEKGQTSRRAEVGTSNVIDFDTVGHCRQIGTALTGGLYTQANSCPTSLHA